MTPEVLNQKKGDLAALKEIKRICLSRACELNDIFDVIGVKVHHAIDAAEKQISAAERRAEQKGQGQ